MHLGSDAGTTERRNCHRLAHEPADVDLLQPDGRDRRIDDVAFDAAACGQGEIHERSPSIGCKPRPAGCLRDRGERGNRTAYLVNEDREALSGGRLAHGERAAIRPSAHSAASRRIGSSSSA